MITKAVFLIILGMHPVDNKVHPEVMGPYASVEEWQAAAVEFGKLADEAGLVSSSFARICFVSKWDLQQPLPKAPTKNDDGDKVEGWDGAL